METKVKTVLLSLLGFIFLSSAAFTLDLKKKSDLETISELDLSQPLLQQPGRYGEDSARCVMNLSLYREFYKQWRASNFKSPTVYSAVGPWRWVFNNCPMASQNTYIDGLNMMEYFMRKASSDQDKAKYVDTLMMIYDQRIKYFGREGYVLGRKGSDLIKYLPEEYEKAYHIFKKSVDISGSQAESFVLVYYFRTLTKMVDDEKVDKSVIVETYDRLMDIIEHNIAASASDPQSLSAWENVKGNIELTFEPYATCEDLIPIFTKKFNETPEDIDLLNKITTMLDRKDCADSDLFFQTSVKLNELEPSPYSSFMIAKMLLKKDKWDEAVPYLEAALDMEDTNDKANAFLLLASVYRHNNDFRKARSYARSTLDLRPDDGNAWLMIGDMYAESAARCGDNDLTSKAAYWAAVDKYIQARNVDPDIADVANKRIEVYSKQFPGKETIFFYDFQEGESYTVECWINEKTTIRAMK